MNILVLGTGTGVLPMFIKTHFAKYLEKVTTVEIDAGVLLVGRDHFGFNLDNEPQIESVCADAYEYVMGSDASGHYDMVFVDLNYEDGESKTSPPAKFFAPEFLGKLHDMIVPEGGLIAMNSISKDAAGRRKIVQAFKALP